MLHSGFHGNRGGVGKPEMLQTPLLLIAAQCTVLQKILLFGGGGGGGGRKESKCLYLSACGVSEIKRNGNFFFFLGVAAKRKETRRAGLVFCV